MPFCHVHADGEETAQAETAEERRKLARQGAIKHKQRLGESIVGDRRETSPFDISFLEPVEGRVLCNKDLDKAELNKFKEAIHNSYFFEMFVEDLPMWGYIGDFLDEDIILGEVDGSKTFLFPHLHFSFGYNNDQIVKAKVTTVVSLHNSFV